MEKNLPAVLDISSNFQIDKQDIVTVAIARGEKKIRENIKKSQIAISDIDKQINEKVKLITAHGEEAIDAALDETMMDVGVAMTALEKYGIKVDSKDKAIDTDAILNHFKNKRERGKPNRGSVAFVRDRQQFLIKLVELEPTKEQLQLAAEHEKLMIQKQEITHEAVNWKKKLSDMPAFERQMRAVVVQDEMNKTENGKAILAALDKNFEDAILMIG
jgi:hypothetical protein